MKTKLLPAIAILLLLSTSIEADAESKVKCEVLTIAASNTGGGIDPALAAHAAFFKQVPFTAFNTYKLVHRQNYQLELNAPHTLKLPAPLNGALRLNGQEEGRFNLTLTVGRPGKKPVAISGQASPLTPLFAAGFQKPNGTWVFTVICNQNSITTH